MVMLNVEYRENVTDKLTRIKTRLKSLARELTIARPNSYAGQELKAERSVLLGMQSLAEKQMQTAIAEPFDARRKAIINGWTQDQFESAMRCAERWDREGDHRQARILRLDRMNVRESVCRELGG